MDVSEPGQETRAEQFHHLTHTVFDALVVGGRITGSGIAWQLARWGIKVALVEQGDFASGTSSRSSKLIHGGFRYLPHGEIRLVHQVSRERTRLAELMPHLITPLSMTVPAYRGGPFPLPLLTAGSWVYDRLGPIDRAHSPRRLNAAGVEARAPGIAHDGLTGGIAYYEFCGHDARITWAVIHTAEELGARALNYVRADLSQSRLKPGQTSEVAVEDVLTHTKASVQARVVVNAAGPWADALDSRARLVRSRGIHLAFPRTRFSLPHATILPTPENANIFAIPKGPITYIGTTDQPDDNPVASPGLPVDDAQYLLKVANRTFPELKLTLRDVVAAWSGVRPLVASDAKRQTDRLSRRDVVLPSPSLITVLGGKFTGFRATAEGVARTVLARLGGTGNRPSVEAIADAPDAGGIRTFAAWLADSYQLAEDWSYRLIQRYGTRAQQLLQSAGSGTLSPVVPGAPLMTAEVDWAVGREQVRTLGDLLIRRTGMAWLSGLSPEQLEPVAQRAAERLGEILGWSVEERARQIAMFRETAYLSDVARFRETM